MGESATLLGMPGLLAEPLSLATIVAVLIVLTVLPVAAQPTAARPDAARPDAARPIAARPIQPVRFTILHTGDLHSCLAGMGPDGYFDPAGGPGDPVRGHYARLAHLIRAVRAEKAAATEPVLLFDAGDAEYGTLFHIVTPSATSTMAPEWQFFEDLGYDAIGMGNHSFEGTEPGLLKALEKAASLSIRVPLLASNLQFLPGSEPFRAWRYDHLEPAPSTRFRRFLLRDLPTGTGSGSLRVGIFGLVGPNAARLCLANRQTLAFTGYNDATGKAEPAALHERAAEMVQELRQAYGAHVVVALFHGGAPEDAELAAAVPGIDVIIAGHTHQAYFQQAGPTIITQTGWGGSNLGRLDLEWTPGHLALRNEGKTLVPVDASVPADSATLAFVEACRTEVDRLLAPATLTYATPIFELDRDLPKARWPANLAGTFVATRLRDEINRRLTPPVDAYLTTYGLIRSELLTVGGRPTRYQYSDVFKISPLGFDPWGRPGAPVVTFWLTRAEFATLLEAMVVFAGHTPAYEAVFSDNVAWNVRGWGIPFYNKVTGLTLHGQTLEQGPALVHLAANEFFARNLKRIRTLTYGMAAVEPRDASGTPLPALAPSGLPPEPELLAESLRRLASETATR